MTNETIKKKVHNTKEFLKMRDDCLKVVKNIRHSKLADMDIVDGILVWVIEYYAKQLDLAIAKTREYMKDYWVEEILSWGVNHPLLLNKMDEIREQERHRILEAIEKCFYTSRLSSRPQIDLIKLDNVLEQLKKEVEKA